VTSSVIHRRRSLPRLGRRLGSARWRQYWVQTTLLMPRAIRQAIDSSRRRALAVPVRRSLSRVRVLTKLKDLPFSVERRERGRYRRFRLMIEPETFFRTFADRARFCRLVGMSSSLVPEADGVVGMTSYGSCRLTCEPRRARQLRSSGHPDRVRRVQGVRGVGRRDTHIDGHAPAKVPGDDYRILLPVRR
jgi:hypothetical protein